MGTFPIILLREFYRNLRREGMLNAPWLRALTYAHHPAYRVPGPVVVGTVAGSRRHLRFHSARSFNGRTAPSERSVPCIRETESLMI